MVKYNTLKPYMDTQEIPLRSQCKVFENQGRNPTSTLHPSSGSGGAAAHPFAGRGLFTWGAAPRNR